MKILAIIPARGGSKRLPNKNILELNGKALIQWTIEAALGGNKIDTVMVSTDCSNIADISIQAGANVPYLRCAELSSDTASSSDVVLDVIRYYELIGDKFDVVILLQPTSPLRTTKQIDNALELFYAKEAFSVVSVTECEHSPLWANTLPKNGSMGEFLRPEALQRSQDLGQYFRLNGAIYIFDVKKLKNKGEICYTSESYAYVMNNYTSIDIDTKLDFELAEFFMTKCISKNLEH